MRPVHRPVRTLLAPLLSAAILVGCGWGGSGIAIRLPQDRQPVQATGTTVSSPQGRLAVPADGRHVVRRGETLFDISRGYGLPMRALIDRNSLAPPYDLTVGQILLLPSVTEHQVARGDTLYSISRRYGVALNELARLNGLGEPFTIFVGQRLAIPGQVATQPAATPELATLPEGAPSQAPTLTPDTPVPAQTSAASDGPRDSLPGELARRPPERPAPPERQDIARAAPSAAEPAPANTRPVAIPNPAPRAASTFLWPVRGRVLSGFGPKQGGLHNDGINIAAPRGTPIRAAENGVVAYAGNQLEGFGNLILVRHADGYMTAYAHAEALLVERGQPVKRGQTIGRVGSTGNVDTPQLHFEIRRGTAAVDPTRLLGG
jgi:murein DD-endopeptidase MepM/ murein hydrolase activator NlpD